jgi:ABC-type bacteriocin/lantibiotic exporter with double-glycine peptidase domain
MMMSKALLTVERYFSHNITTQNYFGKEYTIDFLTKLCFATTEGISLLGINETANTIGLRTINARFSHGFEI